MEGGKYTNNRKSKLIKEVFNMKKYLLILLSLALLCLTFASCDNFGRIEATVTFDSDGGSEVAKQTVSKGYAIVEPKDPTKEGFIFDGWYLGETKWDFSTAVSESITLKAKWCVPTYNVRFVDEDGTLITSQSVKLGDKLVKPDDPVKEGHSFAGWYKGNEAWSFIDNAVTEDVTLTAKWTSVAYEINFVDEDGALISTQNVWFGSKVSRPEDPTKYGYKFAGWYNDGSIWDFETPIAQNITLRAHWLKTYQVTFYLLTGSTATVTVVEGDRVSPPSSPMISGWTFEGWSDGYAMWDINTPVTSNLSLIPGYSTEINYVLDGGLNSSDNPTRIYSYGHYPIQLEAPTKDGYTFIGWSTDQYGNNSISEIRYFTTYTIYANWIEGDYESGDYPWDKTDIIICINEDSDYNMLPSVSRRYLAGDISGYEDDYHRVDDYVEERNKVAEVVTKVHAKYTYLPDGCDYGWGQSINYIDETVKSCDPESPDVYINFVYDMVACSLRANFANLYSSTMYEEGHELAGAEHNYFEFEDNRNYDDSTGTGYMYEYMRSLTLSKWKMYCLSSDYFIDAVRASVVVPVNIELLEMLPVSNLASDYNYDSNEDGVYDIEDFYNLVWDMNWTYETLADFSEAIAQERGGESGTIDINDRVGFALGTGSSLPAMGMLYSTSITIVKRELTVLPDGTIDYTYSYPNTKQTSEGVFAFTDDSADTTFDDLNAFCQNLTTLMQTTGVITVSSEDAVAAGYRNDHTAIRGRFANGNILFGGIITLGSLEHEDYLAMKGEGKKGYGIAPVPLYRTGSDDQYLTQIHNNGKIGAISYTTAKFAQCTAYLNYQSTSSTKVLNEYYNYKLRDTVRSMDSINVDMLKYIRHNVRSNFDKTFEDAIGEFYGMQSSGASKNKWHTMIQRADFQLTDMIAQYAAVVGAKAGYLYNLEHSMFPSLPD